MLPTAKMVATTATSIHTAWAPPALRSLLIGRFQSPVQESAKEVYRNIHDFAAFFVRPDRWEERRNVRVEPSTFVTGQTTIRHLAIRQSVRIDQRIGDASNTYR